MCARPRARPRPSTSRSISSRCSSTVRSRASATTSSWAFPRSTVRAFDTTQSRAHSYSNRCSSSQVRARAAARPRTSSSRRSCSVTVWSSPMPPAVHQSTAATCLRHLGRSTQPVADQHGRTRCSRTTPSSAWACGWVLTPVERPRAGSLASSPAKSALNWPGSCWMRSRTSSTRSVSPPSVSASRSCAPHWRRLTARTHASWKHSRMRSCRYRCGSSVATVGRTTSAMAAWTTC